MGVEEMRSSDLWLKIGGFDGSSFFVGHGNIISSTSGWAEVCQRVGLNGEVTQVPLTDVSLTKLS